MSCVTYVCVVLEEDPRSRPVFLQHAAWRMATAALRVGVLSLLLSASLPGFAIATRSPNCDVEAASILANVEGEWGKRDREERLCVIE